MSRQSLFTLCTAAGLALLLGACATPSRVAPGTPEAAVVESVGRPTSRSVTPGIGPRLLYSQQPWGYEAWAIQFDEQGRAIVVRATLPNKDKRLRPGLFARVALVYDTIAAAILVPEQAIVPMGEDKFVFKVVDGKAVLAKVAIGERFKGRAEIRRGLAAGDTVVTAGQLKIHDGAEVTVLPPNAGAQVGS